MRGNLQERRKVGRIQSPYKRFYSKARGKIREARKEIGGELGAGSELPGLLPLKSRLPPGNSLPALSSAFATRDGAGAQAHHNRTGCWPASGWVAGDTGHYCRERVWATGGARDSKGSLALQRLLSRRVRGQVRKIQFFETQNRELPRRKRNPGTSHLFTVGWKL
jgi:hypothetical protein